MSLLNTREVFTTIEIEGVDIDVYDINDKNIQKLMFKNIINKYL